MSESLRRLFVRALVIGGYPAVLFMKWLGGSAHADGDAGVGRDVMARRTLLT